MFRDHAKNLRLNENVKIVNGGKTRSLGNTFISLFPNLPIWTHKKREKAGEWNRKNVVCFCSRFTNSRSCRHKLWHSMKMFTFSLRTILYWAISRASPDDFQLTEHFLSSSWQCEYIFLKYIPNEYWKSWPQSSDEIKMMTQFCEYNFIVHRLYAYQMQSPVIMAHLSWNCLGRKKESLKIDRQLNISISPNFIIDWTASGKEREREIREKSSDNDIKAKLNGSSSLISKKLLNFHASAFIQTLF